MKNTKSKILLSLLLIALSSLLFYWFQLRPTQIKHFCSWVKQTSNTIPYRPAVSEEQLKNEGKIKECGKAPTEQPPFDSSSLDFNIRRGNIFYESCVENNKSVISEYTKEQKEVPAKVWYEEASKEEYAFCLHDKGL